MMIRRRERELKKLYDSTEEIFEPEITPVLEGFYRIQGPIDESDCELKKPELVDLAKKKQSSGSEISKIEKGTCNVCSTPCFSCSHLKNQLRFCSKLKSESDQVIKEEEIRPSVSQVGNNNMLGCNLTCDPKVESSEEKAVDCKNVKGEIQSGSAKSSLVSDEFEERMTPGTALADGNEADKMTSNQEDNARKIETSDNKSENGKNLSSPGDEKEKNSEPEDYDEIEDDVKVCDICGDVGQEDLLAFCTRCSDGAEHTYCMRVMMDERPEGEWLCEECQIEVQAEKQKEKQKAVAKFDERGEKRTEAKVPEKKPPRRLNSYFQRKEENQEEPKTLEPAFENKVETKVVPKKTEPNEELAELKKTELMDMKKKLPAEAKKMETAETKKPEPKDTKKTEPVDMKKNLSVTTRENPVLDSEMDKGKLGTSLPRGNLSKSTSFKAPSSKIPKVKQITEVPQNPKILKDPASNNLRKESDRVISKSSSFKNPNQSATTETLKKPPPKEPRDKNLMNTTSNINSNNSKSTSILGRPSIGILSSQKVDSGGAAISQGLDNGLPSGRNEMKKPNVPKPSGSLLPRPGDISTCSLLDSILQRNAPLATPRTPRCQRCNETGHAIQSCPKDPTRLATLKPPSERNAKEGILKRPKFMDQKEHDNPMLRMDLSNGLKVEPTKTCNLAPVVFDQLKSTIIPEVDYIWQGGFELVKEGKPPDRYDGFQAHFSSCVSPRVPEIVKKFPFLVRLEEVPRQKTWPVQFGEGGPTENNIAIYFFARDCESYENCYMKLVDSMRSNDVALRGKIGTAELFVFPSNLLPEYSQRWNKLYYLWGVFKGKGANFLKQGSVSNFVEDCNHYRNMETESNSMTATDNCLKDEPDVEAVTVQEKKTERVFVAPPFVDLNSIEIIEEPEPDVVVDKVKEMVNYNDLKKAVPVIGSESRVGPHRERFCENPTSLASNCCDKSPGEDTPCVRSSYVGLSNNKGLGPKFLPSGSSNCPNLMQDEGTSIDSRASRKRSCSMEPISSLDQVGVNTEREQKKAKTDKGDPSFVFSGNHIKPTEILNARDNIEKEILPPQNSKNDGNILYPALMAQTRGNFATITLTDEKVVHQNLNLEYPPRGNSTPDLELALGDTKKSPKKGPMLPFLSSPKVNLQGDGSNGTSTSISSISSISSRPVQVQDETASLSLSLGFPVALSDRSGEARSNKSSGNTEPFPFNRPQDS